VFVAFAIVELEIAETGVASLELSALELSAFEIAPLEIEIAPSVDTEKHTASLVPLPHMKADIAATSNADRQF
jgi:hypothetical protein